MGPCFMSTEDLKSGKINQGGFNASMGPCFMSTEDVNWSTTAVVLVKLQWGRAS